MKASRFAGATLAVCAALHASMASAQVPGQPQNPTTVVQPDRPATRPRGRENRAAAVAPFLGPHTVAVAHVDVARLDVEAVERWLRDLVRAAETDPAGRDESMRRLDEPMRHLRGWLSGMKQAGGRDVFVVLDFDPAAKRDDGAAAKPTPLVVVPLGRGANAEQIGKMLNPARKQPPPEGVALRLQTASVHRAVVLGTPGQIEMLRQQDEAGAGGSPAGLDKALEAVDGEAARLVFVPSESVAAALRQLAARAFGRAGAAQGDAAEWRGVAGSVRWCALKIEAPPQVSLKLVVQAADEPGAKRVAEALDQTLTRLRRDPESRAEAPGSDAVAQLLAPKVEGDRVAVSLGNGELMQLVKRWGASGAQGSEDNPQGASARRDGAAERER